MIAILSIALGGVGTKPWRSVEAEAALTGRLANEGTFRQAADAALGAATPQASGLPSPKLRQNIEWVERETIRRALEHAGGVKKDAAELMGISQRALSYYLAKYRLES